jgi:Ca2+-binding RTX toxin-like protein
MIKTRARTVVALSLTSLMLLAGGDGPSAVASGPETARFTSPFGPATPVRVIVGTWAGGDQYVVFQNKLTNDCHSYQIGDSNRAFALVTVISGSDAATAPVGSFDDELSVVTTSQVTLTCQGFPDGITLGPTVLPPPNPPFYTLALRGLGGRDYLSGAAWGVQLLGDDGNDKLIGHEIYGGDGNDTLISTSSSPDQEYAMGGAGDDCLHDVSGRMILGHCGSGDDRYVAPIISTQGLPGCEIPVTSCPVQ